MDFSTLYEWLKDIMSRLSRLSIVINIPITINIGNNSNNTTVNIVPMNDKTAIKKVWPDIHTDIPVSMPNGKDTCWLHASKDNKHGDYFHLGEYFCVPDNATHDNQPLRFWIGVIHYDKPQLHGMYIWLPKSDDRNKQTICGVACKNNDYYIPIETTNQVEQIIRQMIDEILGSIA